MTEKYYLEKIYAFTQSNAKDEVAHIQACIEGLISFFNIKLAQSNDPTLIAELKDSIKIAREFDEYLDRSFRQKEKIVTYYDILDCQYRHLTR
jgi:SPX domain protein involved in polyphosphate accumulation